ncbi:hypothetical protein LMG23994_04466 [Cupriavidus pinatubonensis]|uniref:Uncharacterized protein n=1 Tax=Cupriavidus pinatubonensis TaxID=248026 RepID=A0ABN7Z9E3_9BURK|nr:hypothetical protein LMG23994_04466 [Cupriavidus pinatubonensis]
MPIWRVSPVDEQPCIALQQWRVMETDLQECHLIGQNVATGMARVSSAIVEMDPSCAWALTTSGRLYTLEGPPGKWEDADYVWEMWSAINSVPAATDVTARFLKAESPLQAHSDRDPAVVRSHRSKPKRGPPTSG